MGDEGQVLELLATDLDRYFYRLVLYAQQRLFAFAVRHTGNPQDAEDIVQEAFIRAYHALANYPAERVRTLKVQAWLCKITLHIFYRHRSSQPQDLPLDFKEHGNASSPSTHPRLCLEWYWQAHWAISWRA